MPNLFFRYKQRTCVYCDKIYIPSSGRQRFCNTCVSSKIPKKLWEKEHNSKPEVRSKWKEQYYKDLAHTREVRNKYNSSEKGRECKKRYYEKNKEKIFLKLKEKRVLTKSRTRAHELWIKTYGEKICTKCGSKNDVCIHHIDLNPLNNEIDNLQALCRRCHTDLHKIIRIKRDIPLLQGNHAPTS